MKQEGTVTKRDSLQTFSNIVRSPPDQLMAGLGLVRWVGWSRYVGNPSKKHHAVSIEIHSLCLRTNSRTVLLLEGWSLQLQQYFTTLLFWIVVGLAIILFFQIILTYFELASQTCIEKLWDFIVIKNFFIFNFYNRLSALEPIYPTFSWCVLLSPSRFVKYFVTKIIRIHYL